MSIPVRRPNTIFLGGGGPGGEGGITYINTIPAGATIIPGMLIETFDNGGVTNYRPQSAAADVSSPVIALEQVMMNLGVDDPYHVNDLVIAGALRQGSTFWGLIPSGQNIANQQSLQSNGDGRLKAATATTAAANVARYKAMESSGGAVTVDTRIRVEVL